MSETPDRALSWEYVEYLEALNDRLSRQIIGYSDRVQETLRSVRASIYRDAANILVSDVPPRPHGGRCIDLLRAHADEIEREVRNDRIR